MAHRIDVLPNYVNITTNDTWIYFLNTIFAFHTYFLNGILPYFILTYFSMGSVPDHWKEQMKYSLINTMPTTIWFEWKGKVIIYLKSACWSFQTDHSICGKSTNLHLYVYTWCLYWLNIIWIPDILYLENTAIDALDH